MGMAASQSRLLALTARMHDIELRAQNIESQKISLATQKDEAYQKYCDALDAKKIQVAIYDSSTGKQNYIDASFNTVCGYQANNVKQYSLVNNVTGKVIVSQEIKDLYDEYGTDKYEFAWAAMGFDNNQFSWSGGAGPFGSYSVEQDSHFVGIGAHINNQAYGDIIPDADPFNDLWSEYYDSYGQLPAIGHGSDLYMTEAEYLVFLKHYGNDEKLTEAYDKLLKASQDGVSISKRKKLYNEFKDALYKHGQEILNAMNQNKNYAPEDPSNAPSEPTSDKVNWDSVQREFGYYFNLWDQITECGGCETINEQYTSGDEGEEWFQNMVTSGLVSLYTLDSNNEGWNVTTIATSVGDNYLREVNDDEKAKKAEAEYEHELDLINRKDTKFDNSLKVLETQENAYKTQIDSVKKIIQDNTERTMNITS